MGVCCRFVIGAGAVLNSSVSYKKEINSNRKEYLMAIKTDGKTSYKPILGLSTDRYAK